jgi:hypothetical protein
LKDFPFATAGIFMQSFSQSKYTIKDFLQRGLELRKFSRKWVPHSFSDSQKAHCANKANEILAVLQEQAGNSFDGIVTGNEL